MLRPFDYSTADGLYQRTKMLAGKYFAGKHYNIDLISVEFEVKFDFIENKENKWATAKSKLTAIAQAMLDDCILAEPPRPVVKYIQDESKIKDLSEKIDGLSQRLGKVIEEKSAAEYRLLKFRKTCLYLLLCTTSSIILWTFNSFIKWQWLNSHPKKIAIYLSLQLAIISALLPIIPTSEKNKRIEFIIAVIGAILCALLSII